MGVLSNITPKQFRDFIENHGYVFDHDTGGHEIWKKAGSPRPVTFQTHINPIPEFIIQNNLRVMGATKKELAEFLGKQ